jgi:hypothetical protein
VSIVKALSWIFVVGVCINGGVVLTAQHTPAAPSDSSSANTVAQQAQPADPESGQEPPNQVRPEEIPEDVPRAMGPGATAPSPDRASASQRAIGSEGAADEGSDLVLRTPDGTERMRFTAAGNAGIGTGAPSAKLHVSGPGIFGKKIIAMPWTNTWGPSTGYIKLVTPIVHTESNMFQIHIVGYRFSPVGDSIDIRCSGYAYAGNYLFRTTCQTNGTDLPVEIGAETRPGGTDPVVVVRIGTPTTSWYYAQFSAEYDGWVAKSPAGFQWVVGETTPVQTGNTNNIVADDNTGNLAVGAIGTAPTTNRLTVNGASTFNGSVGIGMTNPAERLHVLGNASISGKLIVTESNDNSQGVYITRNPVFEPGSPSQMDYGLYLQATENVQSGASNGGGLLGAFLKSHLNGPGTLNTATGAHIDVGAAATGGTVLSGVGLKVNFTQASGSTITTGTGVYVSDVLATNDYAFYQAGADDTNYFAGNLLIGTTSSPTGAKLEVAGNANFTGTVTGGNIKAHYQDVAEWVPSNSDLEPGTVVVLDPAIGNGIMASIAAYDTTVAGVVSAQPGILLGEEGASKEQIATTGRVRVKADASRGAIAVGDLLVTSDKPGYAMRSTPIEIGGTAIHRSGTIVGKALEPLTDGQGEILVLLSLQ